MSSAITFELIGGVQPLIVLPVIIDEQGPFQFVLDTGACLTILTPELAERLAIPAQDIREGMGAAGKMSVSLSQVSSIAVGDTEIRDLQVAITGELTRVSEALGAQIDGCIGYNFLKDYRLLIDYRSNNLALTSSSEMLNEVTATKFQLAHPSKPLILVPAVANGNGPFQFVLDTGASTTVISPELADRLQIERADAPEITGGGGKISAELSELSTLMIGATELSDVTVAIADFFSVISQAVGQRMDGIVGYNFLKEFRVTIDYPQECVIFE